MRNFCSYCGARNNPEATACLACGSPLDRAAIAAPPEGQVVQEPRPAGAPDRASTRPLQAPGAWYSSQQHTPENPHEPSAGTVNAWQTGRHAEAPRLRLPPAGDAQTAYASEPSVPFQPPYPPANAQLPYPLPYTQGPGQIPYLYPPGQAPHPHTYGQPAGQTPYPPGYGQAPHPNPYGYGPAQPPYPYPYGQGPNQYAPAPGSGLDAYGNPYPAQVPPPPARPWPTNVGPYGQPYGQPPIDPYAAPARDYITPGSYPAHPGPDPSYGGYRPTPGYSNFSSPSQVQADYAAGAGYGALPSAPPIGYGSPYSPVPVGQPAGGLADGGQRFGAYLLDSVVLAVPMFFFLALIGATQSAALAGIWLMSLVLCPALYFVSAWAGTGRTIGYRAMGLRLVRTDGGQPSLGAAIARYVTLFACMFFFFPGILGAMWMLWDDRRQGWHDKVADTLVVRS
jgi:uncharacterized RDD family membrane protein YckC